MSQIAGANWRTLGASPARRRTVVLRRACDHGLRRQRTRRGRRARLRVAAAYGELRDVAGRWQAADFGGRAQLHGYARTGRAMFLRLCSPRSANVTCSLSRTCRYASSERPRLPPETPTSPACCRSDHGLGEGEWL